MALMHRFREAVEELKQGNISSLNEFYFMDIRVHKNEKNQWSRQIMFLNTNSVEVLLRPRKERYFFTWKKNLQKMSPTFKLQTSGRHFKKDRNTCCHKHLVSKTIYNMYKTMENCIWGK